MPEVLRPVASDAIIGVWIDVLEEQLRRELSHASSGHCLRVAGLPRGILEGLASRLATDAPSGCEVFLVDRSAGPEVWRVAVHKVVERRNAEESVVLALFPPDIQLAAGDSVDISTFRAIPTTALSVQVEAELLERINEPLRTRTTDVLTYLQRRGWSVSESDRLAYIATVAFQQSDDLAMAGGALFALGLIPDFALFDRPEEFHYRLGQRNFPMVRQLAEEQYTPLQRVLRLSLTEESFRSKLLSLFREHQPTNVREWGAIVATEQEWRRLSLDRWPLESATQPTDPPRIDLEPLKLPRREDDGLLLLNSNERVTVVWQTTPAPSDVPGLAFFRIEVVSSDRVVAWESPLIKNGAARTAQRRRTVKDLGVLDSGVYFIRVIALNEVGDPFPIQTLRDPNGPEDGKRTNESEDFLLLVGEDDIEVDDVQPVANTIVRGYAEAELLVRFATLGTTRSPESVKVREIEWATPVGARAESAAATIRFDIQRQYTARFSQRLRRLEASILNAPETGGHLQFTTLSHESQVETIPLDLPPDFAAARRQAFEEITKLEVSGGDPVVALADLCALAGTIEQYLDSYYRWLECRAVDALRADVVLLTLPEHGQIALLAPTHPLRMVWMLQHQQLARSWVTAAARNGDMPTGLASVWQRTFSMQGIPSLLILGPEESFVDSSLLPGGWGAYLPPHTRDSRAVQSVLRTHFGAAATQQATSDTPPALLADKLELFLLQHPYTTALIVNVINPGDGRLILGALIELERRRSQADLPSMRYEIRLFAEQPNREGVGGAFRELSDPERPISEVAESLLTPGQSLLFPKLSWSRNRLADFLEQPEQFSAHVTVLLDAFPVAVRVSRIDPEDRSSFVHGLIQEPARRFVGHGRSYAWVRRPTPRPSLELPEAPGRAEQIAAVLGVTGALQAEVLAPNANTQNMTSAIVLDLQAPGQSLLYSAHASSTWVLTLDPYLGLDYFDAARRGDRPGYLLDFTPEFVGAAGRQLLLTTRIDDEVTHLMGPAAQHLGLETDGMGPQLLLESLRSLSGRLALRLLSSPSQVQGALGMALARLFLEAYGLLQDAIVIPLDAHPELSRRVEEPLAARVRGDLLVVSADPERRHLDFLLVEAKNYGGSSLISADVRQHIAAQLRGSEMALREAFDSDWRDPDRPDRIVQSWRLGTLLAFYLERAVRYGLLTGETASLLRQFFTDLESGYRLSVRKIGLVFRQEVSTTLVDREDPDVPIWSIGAPQIGRIVGDALQAFARSQDADRDPTEALPTAMSSMHADETWRDIRSSFNGPRLEHRQVKVNKPETGPRSDIEKFSQSDSGGTGAASTASDQETASDLLDSDESKPEFHTPTGGKPSAVPSRDPVPKKTVETATLDAPDYAVLLGESVPTPQFGLIGEVAAEPWRRVALDLNGCNTVSVFGVQGSGKSYTVGSILEMGTIQIPSLNLLPAPLGSVVFHYHQTQDYPPEFVSMNEVNNDVAQIRALTEWGAQPAAIDDLVILTTSDMIDRRMREFPHSTIEPIAFSSAELTVADWRFLMGAAGNDALYLKLLQEVMRKNRAALTLETIRAGLMASPMSDAQRLLAETRLEFASRFVDDTRSLRSLLRPGRLIVVDLRDEFIEKEQALELFVTMLNVFSGAGMEHERFNKLIVFDEAHKYMGGSLIGQVVEVIREMRHKGVSVIIASQDPINVPPAVIELSSVVMLHRFNSPNWLRHIQKSLAALNDLTSPMLASLNPGEAFIWANKATDPIFTRRASKIRMRPRVTRHGGSTRNAVDDW